jgi:hypothetical protein
MVWIVIGVVAVLWLTTLFGVMIGLLIGRWLWFSYRPLARLPARRRLNTDGWRDINVITKLPAGQTPGSMRRRNRNGK